MDDNMRNENCIIGNNSGISLIEIIIVVAIMVILGGAFFLSTSVATDKHVSACGNRLSSSLEQTRNLAMGKQRSFIRIWQNAGDGVYCQIYIDGDDDAHKYGNEVCIGHTGLTVNVITGGSSVELTSMTNMDFEFSRSNGSVKEYRVGGAPTTVPSQIEVTNGRRTVIVKIDKYTGRVTFENG